MARTRSRRSVRTKVCSRRKPGGVLGLATTRSRGDGARGEAAERAARAGRWRRRSPRGRELARGGTRGGTRERSAADQGRRRGRGGRVRLDEIASRRRRRRRGSGRRNAKRRVGDVAGSGEGGRGGDRGQRDGGPGGSHVTLTCRSGIGRRRRRNIRGARRLDENPSRG